MYANVEISMSFVPLSDDEWSRVSSFLQHADKRSPGRPRRDPRALLDAILWVITQGERWHRLPRTIPPSQTCYNRYLEWKRNGTLEKIASALQDRFTDIT